MSNNGFADPPLLPTIIPVCSVSGPVTSTDGTPLEAVVTFDSIIPQIVAGQTIQPILISVGTDEHGQFATSLPQGLIVQIVVSHNGVTSPPMNAIVPLLNRATFNQLITIQMPMGVPEAPQNDGPWARMGINLTWVPTVPAPSQVTGNLAFNAASQQWVQVFAPATTNPVAGFVPQPTDFVFEWDATLQRWIQAFAQSFTQVQQPPAPSPAYPAWAWDPIANVWIETVYNPPTVNTIAGGYGWFTDGTAQGNVSWQRVMPLVGVTNGVAATPGQVGEIIIGQSATPVGVPPYNAGAPVYVAVAQAFLSPGDWDVGGQFAITIPAKSAAPAMLGAAALSTNSAGAPTLLGATIELNNAFEAVTTATVSPFAAALPTQQVNVSVATGVYIIAWIFSPTATDAALGTAVSGYIHARRVR